MHTEMTIREKIYEGKAKIIFTGDDPTTLIQYFKDDATAFNAQKHEVIEGKGQINNLISTHLMQALGKAGIEHHFIKQLNDREQLIRKVDIIPVEVVVRNIAAGSMVKRLSGQHIAVKDGDVLKPSLVEYYLKEDALDDPIIMPEHITGFGLATTDELETMRRQALIINDELSRIFNDIGITLIDFKVEFGRAADNGQFLLADEISPDNCRLWDQATGDIKDKDRFRKDLGGLIEAYFEIAERLGLKLPIKTPQT